MSKIRTFLIKCKNYLKRQPSLSLQTRSILQEILIITKRYSTHIEALKPDNKVQDLPKTTRIEDKFDTQPEP